MGGDYAGCKAIVDECTETIESTGDIDASVHASVHYVHSQLAKSRQDYHGFYRCVTHSHSLSLTHSHSLSLTPTLPHCHSRTHSHSLTLAHSLTLTHSLSLAHSLSLTHSLARE